jgi:ribosomal protein L24
VVKGVNIRKKHQRPISQTRTQTGIIDMELRYCKRCNETID